MLCLGSWLSPSLGLLPLLRKPLRPCIHVHPACAEQEGMVRRSHGEMQQLEKNKTNPQTPFFVQSCQKNTWWRADFSCSAVT